MKEYVLPGTTEATAAHQRADSRFADGLRFNQRGDNYTMLAFGPFLCRGINLVGPFAHSTDLALSGDRYLNPRSASGLGLDLY